MNLEVLSSLAIISTSMGGWSCAYPEFCQIGPTLTTFYFGEGVIVF